MPLIVSLFIVFGAINAIFAAPVFLDEELNTTVRDADDISTRSAAPEIISSALSPRNVVVPGNPDAILGRRKARTIAQAIEDNDDAFKRGLLAVSASGSEMFDERLIDPRKLGMQSDVNWA